jgi:hypothetical protein
MYMYVYVYVCVYVFSRVYIYVGMCVYATYYLKSLLSLISVMLAGKVTRTLRV